MSPKICHLIICIFMLSTLTSCEAFLVLTSSYHKPEVQTPESITRFAKKKGFDDYPILRFDTSIFNTDYSPSNDFLMFNQGGQYLSLSDTTPGCDDKNYQYFAMKYILGHGENQFITDSITERYFTTSDSAEVAKSLNNHSKTRPTRDSSKWELKTITYSTHLNNYAPYLRTLEENKVDVYSLFSDYIILHGFEMYGRPSWECYLIKEKIHEIKKLNKEFGNKIQLVLINRDEISKMK